jgi:hypothetical protein
MPERNTPALESALIHQFKNHLGVMMTYCDILVTELSDEDPRRADLLEIQKAGQAAMALLPDLAARIRS